MGLGNLGVGVVSQLTAGREARGSNISRPTSERGRADHWRFEYLTPHVMVGARARARARAGAKARARATVRATVRVRLGWG